MLTLNKYAIEGMDDMLSFALTLPNRVPSNVIEVKFCNDLKQITGPMLARVIPLTVRVEKPQ